MKNWTKWLGGLTLALAFGTANAGNIYLTGHDVLLHSGQRGYDNVILDYLRDGSPAASYDIGLVRGFEGSVGTLGVNTLEGFGTLTTRDIADWSALDMAARDDFTAFLGGVDVLVIPSHENCGGCDLSFGDADILEGLAPEIATWFNAGGDIYANSAANDSTFYDFLPASAATSGLPISGASGFSCTAAGISIGIQDSSGGCGANTDPSHINGFPTHNRFVDFAPAFTVFEVRGDEIISIGLRDGVIGTDDITTTDSTDMPEPGTLALMGMALGLGALGRRRRA